MRRKFLGLTCASLALAAAAACATSDAAPDTISSLGGPEGGTTLPDGGAEDARTQPDTSAPDAAAAEQCSAAGWCETLLPDVDLQFVDIWPIADGAFALAGSESRGQKILEWNEATSSWSYIDEGSQNVVQRFGTNIWAPSREEVYVSVVALGESGFEAFVHHGTRPVPPATKWSWTSQRIGCTRFDALFLPYVGGTSKDDVYLTFCGNIYRRTDAVDAGPDAGDAEAAWVVDHVDDDVESPWNLHGLSGTASDDIWFVGARGEAPAACAVVLHKTAVGYVPVADGAPLPDGTCAEKPGVFLVEGDISGGVEGQLGGGGFHAPVRDRFVGVRVRDGWEAGNEIVSIARTAAGGYVVSSTKPPPTLATIVRKVWADSEDNVWLLGYGNPGGGQASFYRIIRGTNVWSGSGTWAYSTLVRNGAPNLQSLTQLRGTSNSNLWAVGDQRAFHKTTP